MIQVIKEIQFVLNEPEIRLLCVLITSFIITYIAIPSILVVAQKKNLVDEPTNRSVHESKIPTLGGIAIFAGIVVTINLFGDFYAFNNFRYIIVASVLLFFVGIKDDILVIAPLTKLVGQVIAASVLVLFANIRFTHLHGFWDIHQLNYLSSYMLSVFVMIVIINGMNLIDGIDGLASGIGIMISITFGVYFYLVKQYELSVLSFSVVGAYAAFFRFNVFSKKQKIFMGDTGSLLLGLFLTILVIQFNEYNIIDNHPYFVHSAPSVSFGIMVVPMFDIIRVMLIRLGLRRNPFQPDRNHIHHKLIRLGYSHKKASFILMFSNLFFIAFAFYFQEVSIRRLLLLIMVIAMFFSYLPDFIFHRKMRNYDTP